MKKSKVTYSPEIITSNKSIKANGFTSIRLINIGNVDAKIFSDIPLKVDQEFSLDNRPDEMISCEIPVSFDRATDNPRILALKKYNVFES